MSCCFYFSPVHTREENKSVNSREPKDNDTNKIIIKIIIIKTEKNVLRKPLESLWVFVCAYCGVTMPTVYMYYIYYVLRRKIGRDDLRSLALSGRLYETAGCHHDRPYLGTPNPFLSFFPFSFFIALRLVTRPSDYVPRSYGCDGALLFKSSGLTGQQKENGDTFRQHQLFLYFWLVLLLVLAEFQ